MLETPIGQLTLLVWLGFILAALVLARTVRKQSAAARQIQRAKPIIIDGSNVMHWDGGEPRIEVVKSVVNHLKEKGFSPGIVFDANAGYLLTGKYQHDGSLSRNLGLPEKNVMVVPKGTSADPTILEIARDMDARVVSNDRFRDWVGQYPEIRRKGFVIRGRFKSGTLDLRLPHNGSQSSDQSP